MKEKASIHRRRSRSTLYGVQLMLDQRLIGNLPGMAQLCWMLPGSKLEALRYAN